jgi:Tol biopolymer transport system component
MELIRGESLRDLVLRGPVPLKKLLPIAAGIADGLAAAHSAGLIHRDLKPENVMVTAEGTPKILDFGLVKATANVLGDMETAVRATSTGMVMGTAVYMAPEQARGNGVTIQSDQYALGLILHEMATGRHPFRRATAYETVTASLHEDPPPLGDEFPEPLAWIIERCLAKDPAGRYASTVDLARDLAALRERAATMRLPRDRSGGSARTTFPRVALMATGAALVALAAFALASTWRREPRGLVEPMQLHVATPNLEPHFGEVALPVAVSPDGRRLLSYGWGVQNPNELWLKDLRSGEMRLLAQNAFGSAWSSDSASVAYFAEGKLKTSHIDGGPPRVLCDARPEGTPTWSGDTILFVQYSGGPAVAGIYRIPATGGTPERVIAPSTARVLLPWWPQFLPDGKRFLYLSMGTRLGAGRITHELILASLDGSGEKRIAEIDSRAEFVDGQLLFVRDGTLLAQPFDPDRAELTGESRPLVDGLHYFRSTGMAAFSVSRNGVLAWRTAQSPARLAWVDRLGVEGQSIATGLFDIGRLSRDGTRYAVGVIDPKQGIADVWIYDLVRGNAERATFELLDEKSPVWALDDRTMYYRTDGNGGPPDIFLLDPGHPKQEIYSGRSVENPEDLSPDGKSLLLTTDLGASKAMEIQLLPLDPKGPPRPFASTPFDESAPRFSPKGDVIAFVSNVSGRSEVYVRAADDSGATTRISKDGGTNPRWRADGGELYFFGPAGRLMAVAVDGAYGEPKLLFQTNRAVTFEPAADGSRFLLQIEERPNEPGIQILLNWPARLER